MEAVLLRLTWADWSARCRSEDKRRHVEPVRRYTSDNVLDMLIEAALMEVRQMVLQLLFLWPPVSIHKEMVGQAACYVGLLGEQDRLPVTEYSKVLLLAPAGDRC